MRSHGADGSYGAYTCAPLLRHPLSRWRHYPPEESPAHVCIHCLKEVDGTETICPFGWCIFPTKYSNLTSNMQLYEILKLLMLGVAFQGLQFAQSAVRSNFFGLGCPIYCHQPSLSLLLLFFLLGLLAGSALTAYLGWILAPWISRFEPRHLSSPTTRCSSLLCPVGVSE